MVGKNLVKKISCITFLCVLLITSQSNISFGELNINAIMAQSTELQKKNEDIQKSLKETKNKVKDQKECCNSLRDQITNLQQEVAQISAKISELDNCIVERQKEIYSKQKEIDENIELLKKRLKAVYIAGDSYAIDVILGAIDFKDCLDKTEIVIKMGEHDSKLINKLNENIKSIEGQKKEIEANKVNVLEYKKSLAQKNAELNALFQENEKILNDLHSKEAEKQAYLDESNEEYQRIQKQIKDYFEKKRRLAEEKARKEGKAYVSEDIIGKQNGYLWPVLGFSRISSPFGANRGGYNHKGIDICGYEKKSIYGENVMSADAGEVVAAFAGCHHDYGKNMSDSCGCAGGYGNYVLIEHSGGRATLYAHLSAVNVVVGKKVSRGEIIGKVGTTGHSTGPHLHYETRRHGEFRDPLLAYK